MTDNASTVKRHFSFNSNNGRVRCFELNDGVRGDEVAASVNFSERQWLDEHEACIEAASLPLVFVPVQPHAMPAELVGLTDDSRIVLRDEIATYDVVTTAGKARKKVAAAIERRRLGRLTAREVACLLSRLDGVKAQIHYEFLVQAFVDSKIAFKDADDPIYASIDAPARMAELKKRGVESPHYLIHDEWAFTTATQVNKWLDMVDEDGQMPRLPNAIEPTTPQSAPVVAASDGPAPLTTNDIASCFAGLYDWDFKRWKKELGSPEGWLEDCQKNVGRQGKPYVQSTWFPVLIGAALVAKGVPTKSVSAIFKRMKPLHPWRDAWSPNDPDSC